MRFWFRFNSFLKTLMQIKLKHTSVSCSGVTKGGWGGPQVVALLWGGTMGYAVGQGFSTFSVMEPMKRLSIIYGAPQLISKNKNKKTHCYLPIDVPE